MCEKYLYSIIALFIACYAGLGQGLPEVKPSTSGPLPVRLKELPGKLRWMNWEPVSLTGCLSEGRRSQESYGFKVVRCNRFNSEAFVQCACERYALRSFAVNAYHF